MKCVSRGVDAHSDTFENLIPGTRFMCGSGPFMKMVPVNPIRKKGEIRSNAVHLETGETWEISPILRVRHLDRTATVTLQFTYEEWEELRSRDVGIPILRTLLKTITKSDLEKRT